MNLYDWATCLLRGTSLEEKLLPCPHLTLGFGGHPRGSFEIPDFPGRPARLNQIGKSDFPALHRLHLPEERGKVLHFFANHELLALELMALILLRFPDAPESFQRGVAQIISEEQGHLRLYLSRMKDLGVELGDIPVNDYFWKSMKDVASPLDFTVQMSLTFEQANLDFSYFYLKAVQEVGDTGTAQILERVFQEEMGHVKHGLIWFRRWQDPNSQETEWETYKRLLPYPLNPQRAKGPIYCDFAREKIGFTEDYIRQLRAFNGSKGRPPAIWHYNPHCDQEIQRGRPGYSPSAPTQRMTRDLQHIPALLAKKTDVVLVSHLPSLQWVESLHQAGIETPEFVQEVVAPKLSGIEPWGWSPEAIQRFKPLQPRLIEVDGGNTDFAKQVLNQESFTSFSLGKIFSKTWSVQFLRNWLNQNPGHPTTFSALHEIGQVQTEWNQVLGQISEILTWHAAAMLKAPFGTSGMQVKKVNSLSDLDGPTGNWAKKILQEQGQLVVEPYLNRVADLSIQMKIDSDRIELLEVRQFITGNHHEYRGTLLGPKWSQLTPEAVRFLHQALPSWKNLLRDLGQELRSMGYRGPAGVDAFLYRDLEGNLRLKPLVELNPRWTMGRVALELERHLYPGVQAIWAFLPIRELPRLGYSDLTTFVEKMRFKFPVQTETAGNQTRIRSGVLFTNDPNQAQTVITLLATFPNPELFRDWQHPQTN